MDIVPTTTDTRRRTHANRRTRAMIRALALTLALALAVTPAVLSTSPAAARQDGCALVYSSGYLKSALGSTLGRVRAWAHFCDSGNSITRWSSWGEQKEYQFWNFDKWITYAPQAAGSTSRYKRSYFDARFTGLSINIKWFSWSDSGTANRGLFVDASNGRAYGYG